MPPEPRPERSKYPSSGPPRPLTAQHQGVNGNPRQQMAVQVSIRQAYDEKLRRHYWAAMQGRDTDPWHRAVVWRRLETGESFQELGAHFGVNYKLVARILRKHETAAGWQGKRGLLKWGR